MQTKTPGWIPPVSSGPSSVSGMCLEKVGMETLRSHLNQMSEPPQLTSDKPRPWMISPLRRSPTTRQRRRNSAACIKDIVLLVIIFISWPLKTVRPVNPEWCLLAQLLHQDRPEQQSHYSEQGSQILELLCLSQSFAPDLLRNVASEIESMPKVVQSLYVDKKINT